MKISSQMVQTLSLVLAGGGGGGGRQSGGGVVSSKMSSSVTGSRGLVLVTDKVVSPFALLEVCNGLACGKKQKKRWLIARLAHFWCYTTIYTSEIYSVSESFNN